MRGPKILEGNPSHGLSEFIELASTQPPERHNCTPLHLPGTQAIPANTRMCRNCEDAASAMALRVGSLRSYTRISNGYTAGN